MATAVVSKTNDMAESSPQTPGNEDTKQGLVSVFGDLTKLMRGLKLVDREGVSVETPSDHQQNQTVESEELSLSVSSRRFCGTCDVEFDDRTDQVAHFSCDWHRFNLKRKLYKGLSPVSREKFEDMADDLSSISGSDSNPDSDSEADRSLDSSNPEMTSHRQPLVYFRNKSGDLLSMYRGLLVDKKNYEVDLCTVAPLVGDSRYWAIFMVGGGHFAGAVFDRTEVILHKTFHKYTVRAKRGTSQGMHDQKGSFAKSAGASLRRYNEAQLVQSVQELLTTWSEQLSLCSLIFIRAASYNKSILFSHKTSRLDPPLNRHDPRIRGVPFPTRRPTMNEVKRVHGLLSTITNHGSSLGDLTKSPQRRQVDSPRRQTNSPKPKPVKLKPKPQPKGQGLPYEDSSDSESESEGEIEFVMKEEVIFTSHLADFAIEIDDDNHKYRKKPLRKKKKPKVKPETVAVPEPELAESEVVTQTPPPELSASEKKLRDGLYTACKTGNLTILSNIISNFNNGNHDNEGKVDSCHGNDAERGEGRLETQATSCHGNEHKMTTKNGDFDDLPVVEESVLFAEEKGCHIERLPEEILLLRFGGKAETMLHVAGRAEMADMTYYLLTAGVDPAIKDSVGLVPYCVSKSKSVRNAYRRFMAEFPDRYDYVTAQVPAPLTENMENERKIKENERKKQAKKAKKERQKVQKEQEAIEEAEMREKARYLKLSDREKRALAAERRLVDQVAASGSDKPVLSRCWQCAVDMTGKVPFEYFDYKFCTTKCLKLHRNQQAQTR